ncbi:effector binding domain-containing protein [Clostridiaceae bacterium M8S5]|nr:effector binding domain-containing protein [Clostridiaceae bacterium M8S5]
MNLILQRRINTPEKYTRLQIPALKWAIFPDSKGELQKIWKRIFTEWFPTSGYEEVEGPE